MSEKPLLLDLVPKVEEFERAIKTNRLSGTVQYILSEATKAVDENRPVCIEMSANTDGYRIYTIKIKA